MEAEKKKNPSGSPPDSPPTTPVVKMRKLPFYKVCGEIVKPMKLVSKSSAVCRKTKVHFIASPRIFSEIIRNSEAHLADRILRVQLRFCLWKWQYPQADHLPLHLVVKVNEQECFILRERETIQHPIDITELVHLSDVVPNVIKATWSLTDRRDYAMSICWVKQLTTIDLLQELWAKDVFPIDGTLAIIKEEMEANVAINVNVRSLRVSLVCPLGQVRMSVPCRASSCSHLQVFDAMQYLQWNEERELWRCPVCNRKTLYETLVIDEFFLNILKTSRDCEEIELLPDGSWYPVEPWRDLRNNYDTPGASGFQCLFPDRGKENTTLFQIGNRLANMELQDPGVMNTSEMIRPQPLRSLVWGPPQDGPLQQSRSLLSSLQPSSTGTSPDVNSLPCFNVTQPINWNFAFQNSHSYSHGLPWCPAGVVQAPATGTGVLSGWLPPPLPVGTYGPWGQHPSVYEVHSGWGRGLPAFQPLFGYQPLAPNPFPAPVQSSMPMGIVGNPMWEAGGRNVFGPPVPCTQVAPAQMYPEALSIHRGGEVSNLVNLESRDANESLREEDQTQQPTDPSLAPSSPHS
ncbi:E3 SUMO-protein ligase PIAS3-like isoform X2 [Tachyglossus aculeatus]|uniref:E3 SUMO-protein ligase PIAS3-like isoform X2 n=1 Tax=Tachyglossus aculeatus TaxID=9261 RepID=UPI0018F3F389|nr:E3 SUMO-protein ligase PIAS3-like isoform X2 [Tachyglossus aculeatus]